MPSLCKPYTNCANSGCNPIKINDLLTQNATITQYFGLISPGFSRSPAPIQGPIPRKKDQLPIIQPCANHAKTPYFWGWHMEGTWPGNPLKLKIGLLGM
jgi:hypothetical protein